MSKQLYEEALADVNKVKEIAEDNAKRAIIEAVTPRIRDLIERELLSEATDEDDDEDDILNDDAVSECPVLDLNAISTDRAGSSVASPQFGATKPSDEFEMNVESIDAIEELAQEISSEFIEHLEKITESVNKFKKASQTLMESKVYQTHITQMIANVENIYEYVQGSVVDPDKKSAYETQLESLFQDLNQIQESAEMFMKKKKLNEEDVMLTLTGLPDDIDLDAIGVDLVTGEEEGDGDELSLDTDDEGGESDLGDGDEEEVDFGDMGGDEDTQFEADDFSDDTVVEIDESMLRREIARMRKLREESKMSADVLDDFGGGCDEGDQFVDGEVRTESVEEDEDDVDVETEVPMEALERKMALETKLILRAKARAQKIKEAMSIARSKKNLKLEGSLRKDLTQAINRINEASVRLAKVKGHIVEAKKAGKSLNESRNNRDSRPAENKVSQDLRTKLAAANLYNVKLRYSNQLLQNESLTSKQKAQVISQLDETNNEREAKLVYESLTRALTPKSLKEGSESRRVLGSSSRATRPASTQIVSEGTQPGGFDLDRWSKLAGIK